MSKWKMPPIVKVYEALGTLADGRVTFTSPTTAEVRSSAGDKSYTVEWAEDFSSMTSNDNASYWQGYMGYPIIAVLLLKGKIPYSHVFAQALKGLQWKEINTRNKDYEKTILYACEHAQKLGATQEALKEECARILSELEKLSIERPSSKGKPPPTANSTPKPIQGSLF